MNAPARRFVNIAGSYVCVGTAAGLLVSLGEWMTLGPSAPSAWVWATTLLMALGWVTGLGIAGSLWLLDRLAKRPLLATVLAAAPSLAVTIPVGQTLFDGAFAATLPGARWAPVWVPSLALFALALAIGGARRLPTRTAQSRLFAVLVAVAAVVLDGLNRRVKRSEYPDLHTGLLMLEVVLATLSLGLLWHRYRRQARQHDLGGGIMASWGTNTLVTNTLVWIGFVATLLFGLRAPETQMAVATGGMHTRMLVRLVQGLIDLDRDGHSAILGGKDCNDLDADTYPGAPEDQDSAQDSNCDGIAGDDPRIRELIAARAARALELARWREGPQVRAFVGTTQTLNIVLIGIDALRADQVDPTPDNLHEFPRVAELLQQSLWFRHAYAPAAGTDMSVSGVFTGRIDPFASKDATLAEALQQAGRRTHGVIPSEAIRYVGKNILTRGLSSYDKVVNDRYAQDIGRYLTGDRTTELGLRFVDEQLRKDASAPWFAWVHYFDVHEHHELADATLHERFGVGEDLTRKNRYRLAVRAVDDQVGRLIDGLKSRGLWDRTIVVLFSDHGEGLGEDPRLPENHGRFIYEPLVHVPLALRIPGIDGRAVEQAVSLLDLYPTLIELAGSTPARVDAESLLPYLVPDAPLELQDRQRAVPLNETDQFGVILWPYKLLQGRENGLVELYDLASDPLEHNNLAALKPAQVQSLTAAYAALPQVTIDRTRKGRRRRDRQAAADDKR